MRTKNKNLASSIFHLVRSLAYLFIMQCLLLGPAYALTICCVILNHIVEQANGFRTQVLSRPSVDTINVPRRTVLINGCTQTISLHIARALNGAGYRVVACDFPQNWLNPTRFSTAVEAYYSVPKVENGVQEYVRALCDIAEREKVDVFLPVSTAVGAVYDALAKAQLEREDCECFSPSPEQVRRLNNKVTFFHHSAKCGFTVPVHYKVTCIAEIIQLYDNGIISNNGPFMLTSLRCNNKYNQDSVVMPNTAEEFIANLGEYDGYNCALLVQEVVSGRQLTTSTTILNGCIAAHSACYCEGAYEYDPQQTKRTLDWIEVFVRTYPTKLHGNFIFNFIVGNGDVLYPESCVPGVGVAAMTFYPEKELGECMLADVPNRIPVHPSTVQPVFWLYEEFWRSATSFPNIVLFLEGLRKMFLGREAVFKFSDPMPFIVLNHLHLPFLVLMALLQRRPWTAINFRAGKLV
ncbi:hypothetical protein CHUAL_002458 [Chamberlinius hualienensis]